MTAADVARLLEVTGLRVDYPTPAGVVKALDGVDLSVRPGEAVAVVGESGCGKTTLARSILGLVPEPGVIVSGRVCFRGVDLLGLDEEAARRVRGGPLALTFQNAAAAFNPLRPVGVHVREVMEAHGHTRRHAAEQVVPLLRVVDLPLPEVRARQRAHELSGGMRQRVMLAVGIANRPKLLVADELTTGLDAAAERHVVELLRRLRHDLAMAVVLATHDIALVRRFCSRVVVMHAGRVVEEGCVDQVLTRPGHTYTARLVASARRLHEVRRPAPARRSATEGPPALLSAEGVGKVFRLDKKTTVSAVDDVSIQLRPGETLGLLGESGSGKSTLARLLTGLVRPTSGRVRYGDLDVASLDPRRLHQFRRCVQMVFQDPASSLDPRMRVRAALEEPLVNFRLGPPEQRRARVAELMERVGLGAELADRYPHQLSGGQCQRVAIARALAPAPTVLVCDEPLSSLDVTTQLRILDLLRDLQVDLGLTYLFISHDVAVVRQLADRVAVMRQGRLASAD